MSPESSVPDISLAKPKLRGVFHQYGFFVSLFMGGYMLFISDGNAARVASLIYALSISCLLGTSALYHRINWSPGKRRWMRGLDRAMIIVLIAGSYTPYGLLVFEGQQNDIVFWALWISVIVGSLLNLAWTAAPKWLRTSFYMGVGWLGATMLPQMAVDPGMDCTILVLVGGGFYSVGAIFYATKKPNPVPGVLGYHELFHAFVLIALLFHYLAVVLYVIN